MRRQDAGPDRRPWPRFFGHTSRSPLAVGSGAPVRSTTTTCRTPIPGRCLLVRRTAGPVRHLLPHAERPPSLAVSRRPSTRFRSSTSATCTPPTAPQSLTATPGASGQVALAWLAPTSTGGSAITDYIIQRSPNGTTGWVTINDGVNTATAYTVTGLTNGTRYYFRVLAKNAAGDSAHRPTSPTPSPGPCRRRPRSLTATPTNLSGQITLSWLRAGVERRRGDHRLRHPALTERHDRLGDDQRRRPAPPPAYTVTGLTNGTRYYFRVLAKNAAGNSASSNIANAIPRTVPSAPRTLTAAPTNVSGQIRLTWLLPASNGGAAITDYVIQRSPNGTTGWATINDGVSTTTTLHRDRSDQRHPLLLPGARPTTPPATRRASQHRQRHPTHRAHGAALADRRRDQRRRVRCACRGWPRRPTAARRSPTTSSNAHRTARPAGRRSTTGCAPPPTYTVDRADQRDPLLLPGLRQERRRARARPSNIVNAIPRTMPTAPRSLAAAADERCRADPPVVDWRRRRTAVRRSPTTSSNAHRTDRPVVDDATMVSRTTTRVHGDRV